MRLGVPLPAPLSLSLSLPLLLPLSLSLCPNSLPINKQITKCWLFLCISQKKKKKRWKERLANKYKYKYISGTQTNPFRWFAMALFLLCYVPTIGFGSALACLGEIEGFTCIDSSRETSRRRRRRRQSDVSPQRLRHSSAYWRMQNVAGNLGVSMPSTREGEKVNRERRERQQKKEWGERPPANS